MIIVSSFDLEYNKVNEYFTIKSCENSNCPYCNGEVVYRDSVFRNVKNLLSEVRVFLLRRLLCQTKGCGKLHRELPDIILPYKHYESDVIQSVVDNNEDAKQCCADNSTIRRWETEFLNAQSDIEQKLRSVYAQATGENVPLEATTMILDGIKSKYNRWLAFVISLLINNGHKICTEFTFFPRVNDSKISSVIKNCGERTDKIAKTIEDTS